MIDMNTMSGSLKLRALLHEMQIGLGARLVSTKLLMRQTPAPIVPKPPTCAKPPLCAPLGGRTVRYARAAHALCEK